MAVSELSLFEHRIVTGAGALSLLNRDLSVREMQQVLVLCDTNTFRSCLPVLLEAVPALAAAQVMQLPAGESSKTILSATAIWEKMTHLGMTRNDLLVNLGGGMVTDIGGFTAATYLRGLPFLHVPTSLLGQVDAAIGGKTGVDLQGAKNRVGLTAFPLAVYADPVFFQTLPEEEWVSGCAEVVKHALIADASLWSFFLEQGLSREIVGCRLMDIQKVKTDVVHQDPFEKGLRKKLNFGHTIGHAIESAALEDLKMPVPHGKAVAWGMMLESELAFQLQLLPEASRDLILSSLGKWFGTPDLSTFSVSRLLEWMWMDKKNRSGEMGFSLVTRPGNCELFMLRDLEPLSHVLTKNGARA